MAASPNPTPPPAAPPLLVAWRAGVARLDPQLCRVPGMLTQLHWPERETPWAGVCAAMAAFLDAWGAEAVALGWTTEALFGVHRRAGALRVDSTGALVTLRPMRVVALDAATLTLERRGTRQTFRGLTNPAESVPVWEFQPSR